jgi:hypothetical protein
MKVSKFDERIRRAGQLATAHPVISIRVEVTILAKLSMAAKKGASLAGENGPFARRR